MMLGFVDRYCSNTVQCWLPFGRLQRLSMSDKKKSSNVDKDWGTKRQANGVDNVETDKNHGGFSREWTLFAPNASFNKLLRSLSRWSLTRLNFFHRSLSSTSFFFDYQSPRYHRLYLYTTKVSKSPPQDLIDKSATKSRYARYAYRICISYQEHCVPSWSVADWTPCTADASKSSPQYSLIRKQTRRR